MVKKLKTVSLMLLLMAAPFGTAYAVSPVAANVDAVQQSGTCKGVVKDAAGEAIIGASVVIKINVLLLSQSKTHLSQTLIGQYIQMILMINIY